MKVCENGVTRELTQEEEQELLSRVEEQPQAQENNGDESKLKAEIAELKEMISTLENPQEHSGDTDDELKSEVDELKAALLALVGGDTE